MVLPQSVQAYFEADVTNDFATLIDCFEPSATVRDEGRTHRGHAEIGRWWEEAKAQYAHVAEPIEASVDDEGVKVLAKVTGAFPGSPALLTFAFSLPGVKIAALEIGA